MEILKSEDIHPFMRPKLPPIAYLLLIAHFIFFAIVGSYAFYVMRHGS